MTQAEARAAAWAVERIGQGYIWGATGWVCSRTRREQQARQYPDQADMILGVGAKWDGTVCWDCATFVRGAAKAGGVSLCAGATSQWTKTAWTDKGTLDTLPRDRVVLLYRQSGGKMQHVGLYLGDGSCAHARGTRYGVVEQAMSDYAWTHWASPWALVNQGTEVIQVTAKWQGTVVASSGSTVRVRADPGGKVLGTLTVGTLVDVYQVTTGYCQIGFDGGLAWMQSAFISRGDVQAQLDALEVRVRALEGRVLA